MPLPFWLVPGGPSPRRVSTAACRYATLVGACLPAGSGPHYDTYAFSTRRPDPTVRASPSQSYGVVMSMPPLMLILEVLRPDEAGRLTWLALTIALFALSGPRRRSCRSSSSVRSRVGLTLVFARRWTGRSLLCVLLVANVWAQYVLPGGGGLLVRPVRDTRRRPPDKGAGSVVLMLLFMLTGWLLYGVGAVGLVKAESGAIRGRVAGLSIPVGIGVAFLLFRSGLSQLRVRAHGR